MFAEVVGAHPPIGVDLLNVGHHLALDKLNLVVLVLGVVVDDDSADITASCSMCGLLLVLLVLWFLNRGRRGWYGSADWLGFGLGLWLRLGRWLTGMADGLGYTDRRLFTLMCLLISRRVFFFLLLGRRWWSSGKSRQGKAARRS